MHRPLADEIRPKTLDEVVGQRHLLAPGGVLRRLIDAGTDANMVFYGPSGTGKTTVANIIAEKTHKSVPPERHHGVLAGREGYHCGCGDTSGPRRHPAVSG